MPDYLADTSLIIDLINGRNDRRNFVRQLLKPGDTLGYCTITLIEVYTGMRPEEEQITDAHFSRLLYYEVTADLARAAGRLRYDWRRRGQSLSLADAAIAAVAMHHNLLLLTDNLKHFPMLSLSPLP
ncbi:MAG TPA: PIN domain-containing protein [Bryobacteraceae bacterium]|nr:PIN domain-containing protein [Bryobacteraceae bacterium]